MSTFSPDTFLDATFTDSNSTARVPIPEDDYPAVVKDVKVSPWTSRDGTKSGQRLDVVWAIDSDSARQATGMNEPQCRQGIMLDLTEAGGLDFAKGRNIQLGRLREATGLNVPGRPFSFRMLIGQAAKVHVSHRVVDDAVYDEVKSVTRLG
jgi:hypothetical protein